MRNLSVVNFSAMPDSTKMEVNFRKFRKVGPTDSWLFGFIVLIASHWCIGSAAATKESETTSEAVSPAEFLEGLIGPWRGTAVRTPIGPQKYDIQYERLPDRSVSGKADLIASIHHWTFFLEGEDLKLRFFSTFGGNTKPILLDFVELDGRSFLFKARDPPYLDVRVHLTEEILKKEVYLRGEPHVEIELYPETVPEIDATHC